MILKRAWSTSQDNKACRSLNYEAGIRIRIKEKRRMWKQWKNYTLSALRIKLNQANTALNQILKKHKNIVLNHLSLICHFQITNIRYGNQLTVLRDHNYHSFPYICNTDETWARSDKEKAVIFGKHTVQVFKSHPTNIYQEQFYKEIVHYKYHIL